MKFFQKPYNWIKTRKTPKWLKHLLGVVKDITKQVFAVLKEEATDYLREEIARQMSYDITGRQKMENVVKGFREKYVNIAITDSMLNMAIELLLAQIKEAIM